MTKTFMFFLMLCSIMAASVSFSQYKLQPAFPNLPAFSSPIELVHAGDGTNRIFVAQQRGLIYVFNNNPLVSTRKTFLNISSKVSSSGSETGLLGLAFHPDYKNNRYFYVNFTFDSASALWSRISRFTASGSNPDTTLPSTELILLTLSQPYSNHNGGKVAFGPDGYLYTSFGDGGSGGDPLGNGQNKSTLLGKILRINVDSSSGGKNYSIPVTNPFYGNSSGYKEEIYAYGLRNTWRFSFDRQTNRLWAGDVGQNAYEEIDIIENGKNYGWNKMEGFYCYGTCDTTGKGFTRPIFNYTHSTGLSITGGYVYRGSLLPGLYGKYIYGDYQYCSVWALDYDGVNPPVNTLLHDTTNNAFFISSFGVDQNNEIYVCRYSSSIGGIFKIVNTSVSTLEMKVSIDGFYNADSSRLNMKDTVRIYVRRFESPYNLVDSAVSVLDSVSLKALCFFNNTPNGKYFFVIKHRNSIETWSRAEGDSLKKGSVMTYDFTSSAAKAFESNQVLIGTVYCIYNGEINQDEIIDSGDLAEVENDMSHNEEGYIKTDVTGDLYTDASDVSHVSNNVSRGIMIIRP